MRALVSAAVATPKHRIDKEERSNCQEEYGFSFIGGKCTVSSHHKTKHERREEE
jgi:hypothetical protein